MPVAAQAGSMGGSQMAVAVGGAHSSAPYLSSPQQAAVLKQHQILLEQQKQREQQQQQQHFLQRQQLLAEQVWGSPPAPSSHPYTAPQVHRWSLGAGRQQCSFRKALARLGPTRIPTPTTDIPERQE